VRCIDWRDDCSLQLASVTHGRCVVRPAGIVGDAMQTVSELQVVLERKELLMLYHSSKRFESHRDFRDGPEYSVSSGEGSQDEVPFTASQRHGSHFNEQVELAQPRSTATMLTVREYR
jgi:hypothetical protein